MMIIMIMIIIYNDNDNNNNDDDDHDDCHDHDKTLGFLGGSLLDVIRESPMFMAIWCFWLLLL